MRLRQPHWNNKPINQNILGKAESRLIVEMMYFAIFRSDASFEKKSVLLDKLFTNHQLVLQLDSGFIELIISEIFLSDVPLRKKWAQIDKLLKAFPGGASVGMKLGKTKAEGGNGFIDNILRKIGLEEFADSLLAITFDPQLPTLDLKEKGENSQPSIAEQKRKREEERKRAGIKNRFQ